MDNDQLKAQTFQRLHPRAYLERFIAEDIRPDGRGFHEWRDLSVNVGSVSTADGSALVRLGDTTIVCGVKAEIAEPELDTPNQGYLVPNVDLPAICSPKFKPGPPSEEAQVLSDRLNDLLVSCGDPFRPPYMLMFVSRSNVLPLDTLCIHPGKAVWVIYVDATCINYDGNVFDATLLAMVAALKNTSLPKPTFDEDTGRTICSRSNRRPLSLQRLPISYTLGVFDSTRVLADPTSFEEPLLDASLTVVVDEKGQLVAVTQTGAADILADQDGLASCIELATSQYASMGGVDTVYSS